MRRVYDATVRDDVTTFVFALIFLAVLIIRTCWKLANKEPLLTLLPQGIRFNEKAFKDIGIVAWADIIACKEVDLGYRLVYNNAVNLNLVIDLKNRDLYANRIEDAGRRKKFLKRCSKNNALLWVKKGSIDCDMLQLKRTVFQMKDKMENKQ